jgi:invasion protein IalB
MARIGGRRGVAVLGALVALAVVITLAWAEDRKPSPAPGQGPLWSKQCVKDPKDHDVCFVQQFAIALPQNVALLNVSIGYLGPDGKVRMIIRAPLAIFLPPGIQGTIDSGKPFTLPVESCDQGGCRTAVDMDDATTGQLRRGKVLTVRYITMDRKAVDIPIKLEGLAAALSTLSR